MTTEERTAWTSHVLRLPCFIAHDLLVQEFLNTGDLTLMEIRTPVSHREWEFNSRVQTLRAAVEKFMETKVTPVCPIRFA
ncbi:MAG: hypothetical protein AB1648_05095 [Pseudomonadota bacterium]|jgi:hypothetical protein